MPIGKNSIKRVADNGYSRVKSTAPDMENSTVLANPAPETMKLLGVDTPESAPKKSAETKTKKSAPKETAKKPKSKSAPKATAQKAEGFIKTGTVEYVGIGEDMPIYLL